MSGCSRAVRRCRRRARRSPVQLRPAAPNECDGEVFEAGVAERACTSFVTRTKPVRFRPPAPGCKRGYMTSAMTMPVLVLNASYEPVNITRARRALVLLIKGVAVIEEAMIGMCMSACNCLVSFAFASIGVCRSDPDAIEEEHPHPRRTHLPVLRREVLEQRIGTGACGSARSRRTEHMGEPGSRVSRLQRAQGRSDTDGSRHEVAPSAAPSDDLHLSRFHAPDGSRRGEVEEVSVLLKSGRHSSMPERRLGMAKDAG